MNGYPVVVDPWTILPTALATGLHGAAAAAQLGLAVLLLVTGVLVLAVPDGELRRLRRWGAAPATRGATRVGGGLRIGLAALLLLPLTTGASFLLSLVGLSGALALIAWSGRWLPAALRAGGRWVHRGLVASVALLLAFGVFERADPLALGVELAQETRAWRSHELAWQLENDARAPKVGELAPDFELQDPSGEAVVRLSEFRGKRPVALIFGSYT